MVKFVANWRKCVVSSDVVNLTSKKTVAMIPVNDSFFTNPWLNIKQLFSFLLVYGNASYTLEDKSQIVELYN